MITCYDLKQMTTDSASESEHTAAYFGRIREANLDVMAQMPLNSAISYNSQCRPIIAPLQNAKQIVEITAIGYEYFSISPAVAQDLLKCELTQSMLLDIEFVALEGKS